MPVVIYPKCSQSFLVLTVAKKDYRKKLTKITTKIDQRKWG
jgi:hypothetical protein